MANKKRSVEEIIGKLREAEVALAQGETVALACRGIGVSDHTFYPESTEGRPWGQSLKKPEGAPLNLG